MTTAAGISFQDITFDYPALAGYRWHNCTITGAEPGPHLAIMSGIHLSETASIEAAIRLQKAFDPQTLRGKVTILPLVDVSGATEATRNLCAIDGKNIGLQFPGNAEGSFSLALAYALLHDWAAGSDCLLDLHGADLTEQMVRTATWQRTGDPTLDARSSALALCFDAEFEMSLPERLLESVGRSCSGWAAMGHTAVYSVAGCNGFMSEADIAFHVDGTLRLAKQMGMIDSAPTKGVSTPQRIDDYNYVPAPRAGAWYFQVELGEKVTEGTIVAQLRDIQGNVLMDVPSPNDGWLIYRESYLFVPAERLFFGIGVTVPSHERSRVS